MGFLKGVTARSLGSREPDRLVGKTKEAQTRNPTIRCANPATGTYRWKDQNMVKPVENIWVIAQKETGKKNAAAKAIV